MSSSVSISKATTVSPSLTATFQPWPTNGSSGWNSLITTFAQSNDPMHDLPKGVCLLVDEQTMTIRDGYEKAMYHLLILPRIPFKLVNGTTLSKDPLDSLAALRQQPQANVLEVLHALQRSAVKVTELIQDEMIKTSGFSWPIRVGFHGSESMKHLHLHVISSDLISTALKNKKHYNSFHPKLGYFLHLDQVIAEVEAGLSNAATPSFYEAILKQPLVSFIDDSEFKTIPKLKAHLEEKWNEQRVKSSKKQPQAKERKADDDPGSDKNASSSSNKEKKV